LLCWPLAPALSLSSGARKRDPVGEEILWRL
jgi:hypothetical protein